MTDNPPVTPDLTLNDFRNAGLDTLLGSDPHIDYLDMHSALAKAANEAGVADEPAKAHALGFVAAIASMRLTPENKAAPFLPGMWMSDGRRTFMPEDLTIQQVDLLTELAGVVKSDLLRARAADLVWLKARSKGIGFIHLAIDGYRAYPIDADTWHLTGHAVWHRALQLTLSIGGGAAHRTAEIESALLAAFDKALGADDFEALCYVEPLFAERRCPDEAPRIAGEFSRIGRERLAAGRVGEAESFFQAAEGWYERAQLPEQQAEMLVMIAESLAARAEASGSAIAKQEFIGRAIKAYRAVSGPFRAIHGVEDIIDQLRTKLAAAGRLALGEMNVFHEPAVDMTEFITEAVRRVKGKNPLSALLAFCLLHPFPKRATLYQEAEEIVSRSVMGRIFGGVTLAKDGRMISRRAGADSGADAHAAQVGAHATQSCVRITAMTSFGMIIPALDAMQLESYLTPLDFFQLASAAAIVPRDREDVVAKGLQAGYSGDYVQAVHLLVPQFEHMVRVALQDAGAHTSTHEAESTDKEAGLSTLVKRHEMVTVFGEDLTFTIGSIMCEQEGPNLRNAVAHGLADSSLCNGMHGIYTWWLILRLVVESFVATTRENQVAQAATPDQAPAAGESA